MIKAAFFAVALSSSIIPRKPELWQIISGMALKLVGTVAFLRVDKTRQNLSRSREMNCQSRYHYWYEYDQTAIAK